MHKTYSCTIIISHFESLPFLRACIRKIRKYKHPEIEQHIIIAEQSSGATYSQIEDEFGMFDDITIQGMKPLYSGYGIDYVMRYVDIKSEYICQIHSDLIPVHRNWLSACIKLIEERDFKFVGQLHFYTRPNDPIYYLNKMFFSMSPTFNVARTETYKEMALEAGFTRFHNRPLIDVPMTFKNDDWAKWASEDYNARGSDDDVIAFCWEDNHREHDKLGLPVTGIIGVPPESGFGRTYAGLVFHFGFSCESKGVMEHMGERYRNWTKRINEGFTDELIEEMLAESIPTGHIHSDVWDGKTKTVSKSSDELNNRIEQLKNE